MPDNTCARMTMDLWSPNDGSRPLNLGQPLLPEGSQAQGHPHCSTEPRMVLYWYYRRKQPSFRSFGLFCIVW